MTRLKVIPDHSSE